MRAQFKKKNYNRKHKSFDQKLCFLSSTFSWQPNRKIKENSGSLISYYSQVMLRKPITKITLKRKYQSFLYFSNILLATKQRTEENCSSDTYTHIDNWKYIGMYRYNTYVGTLLVLFLVPKPRLVGFESEHRIGGISKWLAVAAAAAIALSLTLNRRR